MSAIPKPKLLTEEEYLRIERAAEYKSEYYRGEMFAMAGARLKHTRIKRNFERRLGERLDGSPCEPFSSDLRVKVSATGMYTYPDLGVFCGEPQLLDKHFDTLLNPKLLVEILSDSTAKYDQGRKFEQYQTIPSLMEYVLVSQDAPQCVSYFRQEDGHWRYTRCEGLEATLVLESLGIRVPLAEIYAGVEFDPAE